jgi:DNA-binding Xre family transcriptional regulator
MYIEKGMSLKSKTSIARPKSKSLRATIPEGICVFLGINAGDTLEWQMTDTPDGRAATVRKI